MEADETDALQPRHPRARVIENAVDTRRDVKRRVPGAASSSRATGVSREIVSAKVKVEVLPPEPIIPESDIEDGDPDPVYVSEYAQEIFEYLRKSELKNMPDPHYMDRQKDLTWSFRDVLVDWLVQIHATLKLLPETLFLCINIVDRFLSARTVSLVKFQLVGVASLYLAAKYEEISYPMVSDLVKCCDDGYDEHAILVAEAYILKSINFDLSYPGPMSFLRRASKADKYDVQSRAVAKYFVEMVSVDWNMITVPPSLASAASIWLSRHILKRGGWTPSLVRFAGHSQTDIIPVAHKMVDYVIRDRDQGVQHEHFSKKYSGKNYHKVRQYIQDWAKNLPNMTVQQFERLMVKDQ
ncbi:hypothetical protein DACRYDRAFT_23901 [Dacryopinax primogenitus]|uniref:Uncharacterized protein n=1 Tax=Dacryopinax primogenitus (strain DJM 731) TaxID=1858805 RepID=M5FQT5_DACPD|nr:uncharacterized protein DACRYDRAFT_23901 [Dacryopinax primogenitus]EJT99325.1 hypothetical protein DACRYDRAFT_23901 [Dacryopinax primogenitus]